MHRFRELLKVSDDGIKPIPPIVAKQCELFRNWQFFWYSVHYSSGLLAIIAATLASKSTEYTAHLALISALLTSVVTLLGPLQKGVSYKHAYFYLLNAINRYQTAQIEKPEIQQLNDALQKAHDLVLQNDIVSFANKDNKNPKNDNV